ncbi:MAG: hypothetical protein ACOCNC_04510 [Acetivibrio ethanolgignens]
MKIYLLLAALLMLSLCACSQDNIGETKEVAPTEVVKPMQTSQPMVEAETSVPFDTTDSQPMDDSASSDNSEIDVDLTALSSTMVYSEVYNMLYLDPDGYIGKTIKMTGVFAVYQMVIDGITQEEPVAYACIISDAAACCAEGIEFVLEGDCIYPDDYPELGAEITVLGNFQSYEENGRTWYRLVNAKIE